MKTLFVVNIFFPQMGGSARIYYEICKRFASTDVCVLTQRKLAWAENDMQGWKEFDKSQRFKIYRAGRLRPQIRQWKRKPNFFISSLLFVFSDLPLMIYATSIFLYVSVKEKTDIACFENPDFLGYLAIFNRYILRKKTIFYLHGEELASPCSSRFKEKLRYFYLGKANKLIANSRFTANILNDHKLGKKVTIINPGIDLEKFSGSGKVLPLKHELYGKKVLLTITRLEAHRGIDNILRAITFVLQKIPNLIYLIGGSGSVEGKLRETTKRLGLEKYVKFLGFVPEDELSGYYDLCDVFVVANIQTKTGILDGFGMVFIEAGSYGKPVIGGNVGGVREAVVDGETGFLVDGTNIDDIAEKINLLLENPELAQKLGNNGRVRAQEFTWDKISGEFKKVCMELCA